MPAPFIVPFNNNPVSVSVKTASYTIPAGKYARLTINLIGSSTFTIGGVTALQGTDTTVINSANGLLRMPNTPTVPNGTTYGIGALVSQNSTSGTAGVGGVAAINVYGNSTLQTALTETICVPTGTVISGTGTFRIIVEEYNQIS